MQFAARRSLLSSAACGRVFVSRSRRGMCAATNLDLTPDRVAVKELAEDFARDVMIPAAVHHDTTGDYPWPVLQAAHERGLMNIHVPERFGGMGLDFLNGTLVAEAAAYGCTGIGTAMEANNLAEAPLLVAGSEELQREYLGRMIDECLVASYAVTEPGAGSDVAGLRTKAVKKGDEWVINGSKMWITNAGHANWFFVLTRTEEGASSGSAFTAFVVDADLPGVSVGRKEMNMGQRCSDTRGVTFEDVVVSDAKRVGGVGSGFKVAMKTFDRTRPMIAAAATGLANRCVDEALQYAAQRQTMGKAIMEHQAVQQLIADMATGVEAARGLVRRSAWELDQNRPNTKLASMAKSLASDVANSCAGNAVQVFGGAGFNSEYPVEKLMRDAKIFHIYEGTSQIQRMIIGRLLAADTLRGITQQSTHF